MFSDLPSLHAICRFFSFFFVIMLKLYIPEWLGNSTCRCTKVFMNLLKSACRNVFIVKKGHNCLASKHKQGWLWIIQAAMPTFDDNKRSGSESQFLEKKILLLESIYDVTKLGKGRKFCSRNISYFFTYFTFDWCHLTSNCVGLCSTLLILYFRFCYKIHNI